MIIVRNILKDLLYFRHALSYLHCGVVVQFHLEIHDHSPSQDCASCLWLSQRHEEPKITSFNFQLSGIIALSPGGSIFLSGTRISRLIEHKVLGTGIKKFSSGSLEVIVTTSVSTSVSTLWFLNLWILAMGEAVPYIGHLIWSIYIICSLLEKFAPVLPPPSCCCVSWDQSYFQGWIVS